MSRLQPGMDKELLEILVSYKVRVNLMVSYGGVSEGFQLVWTGSGGQGFLPCFPSFCTDPFKGFCFFQAKFTCELNEQVTPPLKPHCVTKLALIPYPQ